MLKRLTYGQAATSTILFHVLNSDSQILKMNLIFQQSQQLSPFKGLFFRIFFRDPPSVARLATQSTAATYKSQGDTDCSENFGQTISFLAEADSGAK